MSTRFLNKNRSNLTNKINVKITEKHFLYKYKLEVWGAQGINQGGGLYGESPCTPGKGGYSYGDINIEKNKNLYICIGGQPYNGGGINGFPGGGATHIASSNRGELKNYASYKSDIYIVAGGVYYFLGEIQYSVNTLAQYHLQNGGSNLSTEALNVLAGN